MYPCHTPVNSHTHTHTQNNRGFGPHFTIIDEAAITPPTYYTDAVLPTLRKERVAGVALLSTPKGEQNWLTALIHQVTRPTDTPAFHVFRVLDACDRCIAAQKALECQHIPRMESWLSDSNAELIKKMYPENQTEMILQETLLSCIGLQ